MTDITSILDQVANLSLQFRGHNTYSLGFGPGLRRARGRERRFSRREMK